MNKRVQKYSERTYVNTATTGAFEPPVRISAAVVSRWGPGDNFDRQHRPNVSLSLITFGNATFEQDGRRGTVERGTIFIAHKGSHQVLKTGSEGVMHKRSLILEGAALESVMIAFHLTGVDRITPHNLPLTMNLFRRVRRALALKHNGFAREVSLIVWEILMTCAEGLSVDFPDNLRQAMEFVQASLHRPVCLKEIAKVSGLSARHCTRLFQKHTGLSPIQYCIHQRMTVAENLVSNTREPFKQIATSLGYENALQFSVRFKQYFKVSPRHYRNGTH
ncbi:MAG: AraC family transcriptional regulator [bacterium]